MKKESVEQMKRNFMKLHEEGFEIKDIAKQYSISAKTVYNNLQSIAENAGVTRESLLISPKSQYTKSKYAERKCKKIILPEEIEKDFEEAITSTDKIIKEIDNLLEKQKERE